MTIGSVVLSPRSHARVAVSAHASDLVPWDEQFRGLGGVAA